MPALQRPLALEVAPLCLWPCWFILSVYLLWLVNTRARGKRPAELSDRHHDSVSKRRAHAARHVAGNGRAGLGESLATAVDAGHGSGYPVRSAATRLSLDASVTETSQGAQAVFAQQTARDQRAIGSGKIG